MRAVVMLVVALLSGIATARAQSWPPVAPQRIIQLRLEGAFAPDRERARAGGADAVLMRIGDAERWFGATKARTVGGDPMLFGRDVLAAVAPIRPNLIALGTERLTQRLAAAADGATVRVEGIVDLGARTYLLRSVAVEDAP